MSLVLNHHTHHSSFSSLGNYKWFYEFNLIGGASIPGGCIVPVGWGLSAQNVMWMPMEGFLRLFGGPGDQKVVVWPVASWADKPLASFGMELGSVTLACFWSS